ncbi:MAG: aminopeptidase P family protein [Bacteroidota bacterium]
MFSKETYINRRTQLKRKIQKGVILLLGNIDVPMNYPSNIYRYRQDSNFLYFTGLDMPGLALIIDIESGEEIIFGNDINIDDIIWMGPQKTIKENASAAGIEKTMPESDLYKTVQSLSKSGRILHFLPPYRAENKILLQKLTDISFEGQKKKSSESLIRAIVALRSVKEEQEIKEIEKAIETGYKMHTTAMQMAEPGVFEREIAGAVEGIAISAGCMLSFPAIVTTRGETLHNHFHGNKLEMGDLLLVDTGAETSMHYACDHTRTTPVGKKFSSLQKDIYNAVLYSQISAIEMIKPNITFRDVHLHAALQLTYGLKQMGLMKGDPEEAVRIGAHALFMPHGLGHMMGLDVHDMEDLGEDFVGYDEQVRRSDIFGTAFLRLGRKLEPGFVLTVEPGCYFIPALIDQWKAESKYTDFINYQQVEKLKNFGGIRIEDNILVTDTNYRILGKPIPKEISEIESLG